MPVSHRTQSAFIGAVGFLMAVVPGYAVGFMTSDPWEIEVLRWAGLLMLGLAMIRPWALATGDDAAYRMRLSCRLALALGVVYFVMTEPLFLILGFSVLAASVLDAAIERASRASEEFLARTRRQIDSP